MRIVTLGGGIGGGKFLRGLAQVPGHEVTAVVNTGDDISVRGLHVSPDLDQVCYWLAGKVDVGNGWGRPDESHRLMSALEEFDAAPWFPLGDRDTATHIVRTELLSSGLTLSEATDILRQRLGIAVRVLPMTNSAVTTRVVTRNPDADLHFQEYWVRDRGAGEVVDVYYNGIHSAQAAPGVLEAISTADVVVICPSNPVSSVGPILSVPGVRGAMASRRKPTVGVSPVIGGTALLPLANKLMPAKELPVSSFGAASAYSGLISGWVIDHRDGPAAPDELAADLGCEVLAADTVMSSDAVAAALAENTIDFAIRLRR